MHVLYLAPKYPVVSETFVSDQVTALRAAGHRVSVLAFSSGMPVADAHADTHYLLPSRAARPWVFAAACLRMAGHFAVRPRLWRTFGRARHYPRLLALALVYAAYLKKHPLPAQLLICHFGQIFHD